MRWTNVTGHFSGTCAPLPVRGLNRIWAAIMMESPKINFNVEPAPGQRELVTSTGYSVPEREYFEAFPGL